MNVKCCLFQSKGIIRKIPLNLCMNATIIILYAAADDDDENEKTVRDKFITGH